MSFFPPLFFLFAQHGWADDNQAILTLARGLVGETVPIVAPSLNYVQTWLRMKPLIQQVEAIAARTLSTSPEAPLRVIGHSMGGLIWLEVLHRHPDWWEKVESLVLLASPVGGADLGRIIDPLQWGIGIASDLGTNRRPIAEEVAAVIPTLVIAGDYDGGSDGTIPIESTKVLNAQFVCLPGLSHPVLRHHPAVQATIQAFWQGEEVGQRLENDPVIRRLRSVPGITDGHWRNFNQAKEIFMTLNDGRTIRLWKNPLEIYHVFVADSAGRCLYAGFVGWMHTADLWQALLEIQATEAIV